MRCTCLRPVCIRASCRNWRQQVLVALALIRTNGPNIQINSRCWVRRLRMLHHRHQSADPSVFYFIPLILLHFDFLTKHLMCSSVSHITSLLYIWWKSIYNIAQDNVLKPKFHYADFPVTSATSPRQTRDVPFSQNSITASGDFPEVAVMEFWLKGTSRVCRGRHGEVGIVEFGLNYVRDARTHGQTDSTEHNASSHSTWSRGKMQTQRMKYNVQRINNVAKLALCMDIAPSCLSTQFISPFAGGHLACSKKQNKKAVLSQKNRAMPL